jgi:hypothetical protein
MRQEIKRLLTKTMRTETSLVWNRQVLLSLVVAACLCTSGTRVFAATTITGDTLKIGTNITVSTSSHLGAYSYNTVGGGVGNANSGDIWSVIGGGYYNWIPQSESFTYTTSGPTPIYSSYDSICGGRENYIGGDYGSVIAGGYVNIIDPMDHFNGGTAHLPNHDDEVGARLSFIGGGAGNQIHTILSVIAGGNGNYIDAWANYSAIGGGIQNVIAYGSGYSVISGGTGNIITNGAWWGSINGGSENVISGKWPPNTVWDNPVPPFLEFPHYGWIGGGLQNVINNNGRFASICGGSLNTNGALSGFIGGGKWNVIGTNADYASIVGGYGNSATGTNTVIGGGYENTTSGANSTVPGGANNMASGNRSFAAGSYAHANNDGSFVWADYDGGNTNQVSSSGS